uniref:Uncharacterized protein n=1 Tax=Magnetococcus massalia (strain MO-1) TaxID=451514 RepID=A0A1S7LQ32_MAGMO|nr:protein of unknown function [Candidatus Magnetococcus massalia]
MNNFAADDVAASTDNCESSNQGELVPLSFDANLNDTDGSEDLYFVVDDLPDGAILTLGTDDNGDTIPADYNGGDGSWVVPSEDAADVMLLPPSDVKGGDSFDLSVTAVTTEENGDISFDTQSMNISFDDSFNEEPVAEEPKSGGGKDKSDDKSNDKSDDKSSGKKGKKDKSDDKSNDKSDDKSSGKKGKKDKSDDKSNDKSDDKSSGKKGKKDKSDDKSNDKSDDKSDGKKGKKDKSDDKSNDKSGDKSGNKEPNDEVAGDEAGSDTGPATSSYIIQDDDLPEGTSLNTGFFNPSNGTWVLNEEGMEDLIIDVPNDFEGELNLEITSVTTEANGSEDVTTHEVDLDPDAFEASDGDDKITGTSDGEWTDAGAGDDVVDGLAGDDLLDGGDGDDQLSGGDGDDIIQGGDGNDVIEGGAGDDMLSGGAGDDLFIFGMNEGSDFISGGSEYTDVIRMDGMTDDPNINVDGINNWTIETDDAYTIESVQQDGEDLHSMVFEDGDASGSITLEDGSEISFDDIDQITW